MAHGKADDKGAKTSPRRKGGRDEGDSSHRIKSAVDKKGSGELKHNGDHSPTFKEGNGKKVPIAGHKDDPRNHHPSDQLGHNLNLGNETISRKNSGPEPYHDRHDKGGKNGQPVEISFADIQATNHKSKDRLKIENNTSLGDQIGFSHDEKHPESNHRPKSGFRKHEDGKAVPPSNLKGDKSPSSPKKMSGLNSTNPPTDDEKSKDLGQSPGKLKGPPPKAKKFYEKTEPSKITDLNTTSMFKNGLMGAGAGRSASTGQNRFKKKGHLQQMDDLMKDMDSRHERSANGQNIFKQDLGDPSDSNRSPKIDLFFKRYNKMPMRLDRIDHDEIKAHANGVKVAQLEADRQREERRKRFVGFGDQAEEWKRNNATPNKRRSADNYASYRKMYNEHLEKSLEAHKSVEKLREKRQNRYMYGEKLKQMAGFQPNLSLERLQPLPKLAASAEKRQLHNKELQQIKQKKEVGNLYMKQAIEVGKENLNSPKVNLKSYANSSLDDGRQLFHMDKDYKPKGKGLSKEELKKYYNVHDIFKKRDKFVDDKGNNYSKLEALRKVDHFTSPETQAMAVNTIKSIDREIKLKEHDIKNGIARDDNIEKDYLRSIKTKLEVINQRVEGVQQSFEGRAQSSNPNRNSANVDLKKRAEDLKAQRAKSALRPVANKDSERRLDDTNARPGARGNSNDRADQPRSKEVDRKQMKSSDATRPFPKDQDHARASAEDAKNRPQGSSNDKPKGITPKYDKLPERKPDMKPNIDLSKEKLNENKGQTSNMKPNMNLNSKANHKEIKVPVAHPNSKSIKDKEGSDPMSPANSISDKERKGLPKEDLNHPLIKKLSEDLDEDPSQSVSISQQKRKQQELGEYFEKKQPSNVRHDKVGKGKPVPEPDNYDDF
jgi:hypothetical protein